MDCRELYEQTLSFYIKKKLDELKKSLIAPHFSTCSKVATHLYADNSLFVLNMYAVTFLHRSICSIFHGFSFYIISGYECMVNFKLFTRNDF